MSYTFAETELVKAAVTMINFNNRLSTKKATKLLFT